MTANTVRHVVGTGPPACFQFVIPLVVAPLHQVRGAAWGKKDSGLGHGHCLARGLRFRLMCAGYSRR